ncbi:MAG TPA: hypothetical protein VGJ54_17640, partial [Streptosporangiaceae bacterium]
TGRPPFGAGRGSYEQLTRRADSVRVYRRVPAAFATAVDSCLEPEPARRPTVDQLFDALCELAYV